MVLHKLLTAAGARHPVWPGAVLSSRRLAALLALVMTTGLASGCVRQPEQPAAAPAASYARTAPAATDNPLQEAGTIALSALPAVGQDVYRAIHQGGPFAFDKDGVVFSNRERQLPRQPRGYYREYTVASARAHNRGARRIVCGGEARTPEVCYYTADHYASFRKIVP